MIKIIEMNFTERNNLKNENLLSSPIYKIYNYNRKNIPDDQTSATSDHSVINKKKILKTNKSIPLLKISSSLKVLFKNDNNINNKDFLFKKKNNKKSRNFLPDISVIESCENMKVNNDDIKKSSNKNLSIKNFKNHINLKSTDNINKVKNNKIHNLKDQIQKLLKRHKLNSEKKNLKKDLLIKSTDITRKRYYFGFMNIENNNNKNIKTIIENNNKDNYKNNNENYTNQFNFEKRHSNENLTMKTSYSVPRMKIKPISEFKKKGKNKFDIDKLIEKRFKNIIENKIKNLTSRKKLKLQPLKFNKFINNKNLSTFDKVLSERDIFNKTRNKINNNDRIFKTINITNFVNLKKDKKKQSKKKVKINEKILFTHSILKNDFKSTNLSNLPNNKSVHFQIKENKTLKQKIQTNKSFKELLKDKDNMRYDLRKKTERLIKDNNYIESNYLEEENSHEYEMSNSDSDEEKKKRKQKERKKFRNRISSSTLILSKQIIKSYEFINISPHEKKFLISLYPENLFIKKIMSSNYNLILSKTKNYIYEKIKIKEKDYIKKFKYTTEMFITKNIEQYTQESIDFVEMELKKINNCSINEYKNVGLNHSTSFHLMNKYLSLSPQLIERFIYSKTNDKIDDNNKNRDLSFLLQTKRKKSNYNMEEIKLYESMAQKKHNIIFYQNFIYLDYGEIINNLKIDEYKNSNSSENEKNSDLEENTIHHRKKKKKKIHLNILRKRLFFQMKNIKRKKMSSIFDKYLKYGDEIISVLVENIERLKNKNKNNSLIGILCYRLFDYLIRTQSTNLVLTFHHKYHNLFDINITDNDNNGDSLLIIATKENLINVVKYFLEKGADPNLTNNFGNTAMHYAISFKYFDIADLLKKNGAREDITNYKGLIPWECVNGKA